MKKRMAATAAMVALTMVFGAAISGCASEQAAPTTIQEFDRQTEKEQSETIRSALATIYNYYAAKDPDKASCMVDLYKPPSEDNPTSKGYDVLVYELDKTRGQAPEQQRSVERIIFDIVNKECSGSKRV